MRFGFPALTTRFTDCWDAIAVLRDVLDSGCWRDARYDRLGKVS
jgi:kynureninase